MDDEDVALLVAISKGSQRAFNQLIDRHQQAIRIFVRRLVGWNDSDDVAQDTFLAVWTQSGSFRGGSPVRSWLFGIAWRKAKDTQRTWFRRRRRDAVWHEVGGDNTQSDGEIRHALDQALTSLSLDQRAAVTLCLAYGLSHAEASDALNMPLGTVKSHVTRGRDRLREVLGEES